MSFSRILTVLKKDLKRAPRSGIVFLALAYPVLITLLIQLIFGSIFDPMPRVGVIDHGNTVMIADMKKSGVELTEFENPETMWKEVELGNLDVGLIYPANFDNDIQAGNRPAIEEKISTRANIQALIKLEGIAVNSILELAPETVVDVEQVTLTDSVGKSWTERLLPLIVLLALFVAGTFLTGFAIVDEKIRGTLRAMLITPAKAGEIIIAKGIFSFGIALLASGLTLWLNGALHTLSPTLLLAFTIAALMTIEFGIMVGFVSKDVNSLYGIVKGLGPIVILTILPFLWAGWPAWISKIIPLWYVIKPIVGIVNEGKVLADVSVELGIGALLCILFVFVAAFVAKQRVTQLDALT